MEFVRYQEKPLSPDKGLKGGSCNRRACQLPYAAFCYNHPMDAYYCIKCARDINHCQTRDGGKPFIDIPDNYHELWEAAVLAGDEKESQK